MSGLTLCFFNMVIESNQPLFHVPSLAFTMGGQGGGQGQNKKSLQRMKLAGDFFISTLDICLNI
jgi:hypothetical protein